MKAIMTGVALAALIAGTPALAAGGRLQVAQADQSTQPLQEMQAAPTTCAEGATMTAEGAPCPPDASESAASATGTAPSETVPPAADTAETVPATPEDNQAIGATTEPQEQTMEIAAAEGGKFIEVQSDDAVLASELIGLTVYNPADEALGDVNDIVWSDAGGIEAVIVGVGGFLGIGEKSVAVSYSAVDITTDEDGDKKLVLTATEEELSAAPEFVTSAEKLAMMQSEQEQTLPAAESGGMAPAPEPVPAQ